MDELKCSRCKQSTVKMKVCEFCSEYMCPTCFFCKDHECYHSRIVSAKEGKEGATTTINNVTVVQTNEKSREVLKGVPPEETAECKFLIPDVETTFDKGHFAQILSEAFGLCVIRNTQYGRDNMGSLGPKGAFVELWNCACRLKEALWIKKHKIDEDKITDIVYDLINFAVILELLRREQW